MTERGGLRHLVGPIQAITYASLRKLKLPMDTQWLFPLSALSNTPSRDVSTIPLERELRGRAKGVEFLFRVAAQLGLSNAVFCAAAQYFHRFYMRYSIEDYPRQEVAAASVFLATKTEENSRKLKDVSFAELVDLLLAFNAGEVLEQYAWTLVNDSLRTPLCILQPPRIIATACFILAQRLAEGPNSASLDERIYSRSSASLPTPPHMHPRSPPSANFAQGFFQLSEPDMEAVAITVAIMLNFYAAHTTEDEKDSYLRPVVNIPYPSLPSFYKDIYSGDPPTENHDQPNGIVMSPDDGGITPASMGRTPHRSGWTPTQDKPQSPILVNGTSGDPPPQE
ncbi:hypothetical protein JB92DRAFT_3101411 [Gautieria morchelliformis]|nr:hypothetical protein JB92DRAFT_3101411 [Gautieria morchelliformis]